MATHKGISADSAPQGDKFSLTDLPGERWLPIPGHEGIYEVSDLGRVKSLSRAVRLGRGFRIVPEKILIGRVSSRGYIRITLRKNNRTTTTFAHRLVLLAFVGPCPEGMEARHFPSNDRTDCRLANLSWATKAVNDSDRHFHGTARVGIKSNLSKLTEDEVIQIRSHRITGGSYRKIAEKFGVDRKTVMDIVARKSWAHIK